MNIKITTAATEHMKKFLEGRGKGFGIRLGVQTSGCSGMSYVVEFVDNLAEDDEVLKIDGVNVVVSKKSLLYIDGIEVDYEKLEMSEGFKFTNPNVADECGCGKSFTV